MPGSTMRKIIRDIKDKSPHGNGRQMEHLRFINRIIDIRSKA